MRPLSTLSLCALLILVAGCDTIVDPPVIDDPPAALLPLDEGNYWVLDRMHQTQGIVARDTLTSTQSFTHAGELWTQITGTSSFVECTAAFFTVREDGYYRSTSDPRTDAAHVHLKYAYPAEVGTQYVIEPHPSVVSGDISWGMGPRTVTVVATDELIDTPFGPREAYRYRFTVETYYWYYEERPAIDVSYDRVLIPGLGFVWFDTAFLTLDTDTGSVTKAGAMEWSLVDVHVQPTSER